MKTFFFLILLVTATPSEYTVAQNQNNIDGLNLGGGYSIIPSVIYVSSATIQLNATSPDLFERSLTEELSGGYGYGLTIRKKIFNEDLSFGFSIDYMKIYDDELTQSFATQTTRIKARVTEELWMLPVEFTGYFNIPNFTEDLEIFLGGGVGVYFGDRRRSLLNIQSKTISKEPNFSFVILSGMELIFSKQISGVFEIRFRQGEYRVQSQFPVSSVMVNGVEYPLEKNLNSNIFVDGLKLSLGVAYNF